MAEKSLMLTIGGIFKGDAFKKARAEVAQLNNDVKKGAGVASQLASAFGGLDASASRAVGAVSNLVSAFVTGGIAGAGIATVIGAVNLVLEKSRKEFEALQKAVEKMGKATDEAMNKNMSMTMSDMTETVKSLAAEFDSITKQADAFTAAIEGVRAAGAQGGILKLQTEKLQAMMDAHTEAERQTIEAEYNIKIAAQKRIEAEEAGAMRISAATEAMEQNQKRVANIDEQLAKVMETRAYVESQISEASQKRADMANKLKSLESQRAVLLQQELEMSSRGLYTGKVSNELQNVRNQINGLKKVIEEDGLGYEKRRNQLLSELNKIKEQQSSLEAKRNDALANANVLELNLQKAKQEAANATEVATQGVLAAQLADDRLKEAKHARKVAEKAAKEAAELDAAAKVQDAQEVKTAAEIQADVNKAAKELEAAQREYAEAIDKWVDGGGMLFDAIQQNLKDGNKNWTKAGVLDAATQKDLAGKVGAFAVDEAVKAGAKTVRDLQRAERDGERRGRDALSRDSGQMEQEAKRYERLSNRDRSKLSKADKDFMDKFEKLQNANKEEKKKIADREANIKELATNTKELRKAAENIEKKLDKLGLK